MRLISIRKLIAQQETDLGVIPDEYHGQLKQELDQLLFDIIGVPEEGQHQVNTILNRAIDGDIKTKTAVVAIHEIYNDFKQQKKQQEKKVKQDKKTDQPEVDLQKLYQSGYR